MARVFIATSSIPPLLEARSATSGRGRRVAHVVLFALGTVLFVPGALFGLAGGALFGPFWGTLLNLPAPRWVQRRHSCCALRRRGLGQAEGRRQARSAHRRRGGRGLALRRLRSAGAAVPVQPRSTMRSVSRAFPSRLRAGIARLHGARHDLAYTWLGYARSGGAAPATKRPFATARWPLALLAAVAFLPRLVRRLRGDRELKWIEIELLARWLKDGTSVILIDVRGPDEFTGPLGHLPNALNLPVGTLPGRLKEIEVSDEQPIVLVCRTDKRSAKAAIILHEAGFRDVRVLRGGIERWNGSGQ